MSSLPPPSGGSALDDEEEEDDPARGGHAAEGGGHPDNGLGSLALGLAVESPDSSTCQDGDQGSGDGPRHNQSRASISKASKVKAGEDGKKKKTKKSLAVPNGKRTDGAEVAGAPMFSVGSVGFVEPNLRDAAPAGRSQVLQPMRQPVGNAARSAPPPHRLPAASLAAVGATSSSPVAHTDSSAPSAAIVGAVVPGQGRSRSQLMQLKDNMLDQDGKLRPDDGARESIQDKMRKALSSSSMEGNAPQRAKKASRWTAVRQFLLPVIENNIFKAALMASVIFALFGGSLWALCNVPDKGGIASLDALMSTATVLFIIEMVLTCIVRPSEYPLSAFFWMDLLGTVSMIFEISFLCGSSGKPTSDSNTSINTVLLRSSRAAKLGARVGRLTKTVKCITSIGRFGKGARPEDEVDDVKVIFRRLMIILSAKVSLLAVVLMLVSPLFSIVTYPLADYSMEAWAARLEVEYKREAYVSSMEAALQNLTQNVSAKLALEDSTAFHRAVAEMQDFYQGFDYFPYTVVGFPQTVVLDGRTVNVSGSELLTSAAPVRADSIVRQDVSTCLVSRPGCDGSQKASLYFDFTKARQLEAGMEIVTIMFMILVMLCCAFDLSRTLDYTVLYPLQRMMSIVRAMTANIHKQVMSIGPNEQDDALLAKSEDAEISEIELLEIVFQKLAKLSQIFMQQSVVEEDEMEGMFVEGRGIILDMMQLGQAPKKRVSTISGSSGSIYANGEQRVVKRLPVDERVIDTWELDLLNIQMEDVAPVILFIFFDSPIGVRTGRAFTDPATFQRFHDETRSGYKDTPYHNYMHAADVTHTIYRFLTLSQCEHWIPEVDQYALLVSAMAHDIGHAGRTNQFLVETKHELALRYNDQSPLENMHCATLFQICSSASTNVFATLDKERYGKARKVCISTILHTDNAHHFEMVKDISRLYELANNICDQQAAERRVLGSQYLDEVLRKHDMVWMQLFLHLADVSNPLKPFQQSQVWAVRILDEFFAQGDEERELGIPVGMLNDRQKTCRPAAQHGFINFLVAPLVFGSVRVFPVFLPLAASMAKNLGEWRDLWVQEMAPCYDEVSRRDADIQKVRDEVRTLELRGMVPSVNAASIGAL